MEEAETPAVWVTLDQRHLDMVRQVLARRGVTSAHGPVIFGSRATGKAQRYSDLDLGFIGEPVTPGLLARIVEDLEESDLPITVDVVDLTRADGRLRSQALRDAVSLDCAVGNSA